jgi:transmembrane sensor
VGEREEIEDDRMLPPGSTRAQGQAADWLARLASGEATDADLSAFKSWRAESLEHAQAADELWSLWLHADQMGRLPTRRTHRSPVRYWPVALAASLIVGLFAFQFWHDWRFDQVTMPGERRSIVLLDGTQVDLNSDTALSVRFDEAGRHVSVARGEAYFEVVHSPRPFVVESGAVRVRDLGTAFAVRRSEGGQVQILVERGEVEVQADNTRVRLDAGQTAVAGSGPQIRTGSIDPVVDLAWRRGRLIFVDQTLASVVRSLERHRSGAILITNQTAANLHIDAAVSLEHIDEWLLALPHAEPVRVVKLGPIVWIH